MSNRAPTNSFSFSPPRRWVAGADFPREQDWGAILSNPDRYLIKRKLHREVLFLPGSPVGTPGYYLKIFHPTRPARRLLSSLPPSAAAREFYLSHYLARRGIEVAPALGFARYGRRGRDGGSIFISLEVQNVRTFAEALGEAGSNRASLLLAYGSLLGRLNKLGLYVQDYYMDNVLVRDSHSSSHPELVLLDHEATRPLLGYFPKWRERNLIAAVLSKANLPLSEEEMVRVFTGYLAALNNTAPNKDELQALRRRLDLHQVRLDKRRTQRSRFKRAEHFGELTIYRRRDVNGTELIAAWNELHNEAGSVDVGEAKPYRLSAAKSGSLVIEEPSFLTPVIRALRLSRAQRAFREAQQYDSAGCIGMVEEKTTGRSVLFFCKPEQDNSLGDR